MTGLAKPGGNWSKIRAVAGVNQRRAGGDRRFLFLAAGLPLLIILLVGILFGSAQRAPLGVIQLDKGPLATRLVSLLERSNALKVSFVDSRSTLRDNVLRQLLADGIVIPADFDATLRSGHTPHIDIVTQVGSNLSAQGRAALVEAIDLVASEWTSAVATASRDHVPMSVALSRAQRTTDALYAVVIAHDASNLQSPYAYTTAGNLVLFGFLTLLVTSAGLVESRTLGLLRRILATPTPTRVVVIGQTASVAALGIIQGLGLLVIGALLFGVHWGDPVAAVILVVAVAMCAAGASVCLGASARSEEQAIAAGSVGGIALGMLGGCMWPLDIVGSTMRTIGHVTPQAWAMDAFVKLEYNGSGLGGILPQLGVLLAFAAVLLTIGARQLRRSIVGAAA